MFLTKVNYGKFFSELRQKFSPQWGQDANYILQDLECLVSGEEVAILKRWCWLYHQLLLERSPEEIKIIAQNLQRANPLVVLSKSKIETIWQAINEHDNWQMFVEYLIRLM